MALSDDDWADVAEIVDGYAEDIGGMTPEQKRDWAWKKAQGRGNPRPEYDDFDRACRKYGWAMLDRRYWRKVTDSY